MQISLFGSNVIYNCQALCRSLLKGVTSGTTGPTFFFYEVSGSCEGMADTVVLGENKARTVKQTLVCYNRKNL